ncbi:hypothetical protein EHE19_002175 [Ruminiclostridium herbifermentans]|uniref:Uncharacterized protein n=1 Tax=Ruminiclostridium herbifermentans TaxID=2488810 RepID=A0A4V6ENR9_9FIRM|nr:hypothetical protein [Ruminiclostridium herbifermentans]QNU67370.1 hypothetical protein EHE19_002175 [Ruminiclostridium herbifermentans]
MLATAEVIEKIDEINPQEIAMKIKELKKDERFTRYVGSASSNPTSITNKVKIAKEVLYNIGQDRVNEE